MTKMAAPINFDLIDKLGTKMLLRTKDKAMLFCVSRMTYNRWVNGKAAPHGPKSEFILDLTRRLMVLVMNKGWPSPDVVAMKGDERYQRLLEELEDTA